MLIGIEMRSSGMKTVLEFLNYNYAILGQKNKLQVLVPITMIQVHELDTYLSPMPNLCFCTCAHIFHWLCGVSDITLRLQKQKIN